MPSCFNSPLACADPDNTIDVSTASSGQLTEDRRPGRSAFANLRDMLAFFTTLKNLATAVRRGLGDPRFRALGFLVVVLLATGTIFYWWWEDWTVLDSLYFSVITLTTIGYGDLAPTRAPTKIFTIVYVLIGLGVLLSFLSIVGQYAIDARVEKQRKREKG